MRTPRESTGYTDPILSPHQDKLLEALAAGRGLKEAAAAVGVTYGTARVYMLRAGRRNKCTTYQLLARWSARQERQRCIEQFLREFQPEARERAMARLTDPAEVAPEALRYIWI